MIRVTEHTRRKPGGATCAACRHPIRPGDRYRVAILVQEREVTGQPFQRRLCHVRCIPAGERDLWEIR